MEVAVRDWILVSADGVHVVGCVSEIAELFVPGSVLVRMLLTSEYLVENADESKGGMITVDRASMATLTPQGLTIDLECVSIVELSHTEDGTCMQFVFEG